MSKDQYSELKKQQFVPIHVPESAYASAAKSAEPSNLGPAAASATNNEEYEFRLNMPAFTDDELKTSRNAGESVYSDMFKTVTKVASTVWGGIELLSTGVSDFLGVTSPRYDIWMEDSIKYQESLKSMETPLESENAAILKSISAV